MMPQIVLSSKSPRRREMFSVIAKDFLTVFADVDEGFFCELDAESQTVNLARMKCLAVAKDYPEAVVVGCDTLVELQGTVFGKPVDEKDARRMLAALSGNTHNVYTGVCIYFSDADTVSFSCKTEVTFHCVNKREMDEYIASGDSFDKAGAYGIQGMAARYIKEIKGDYFNVLGLPVSAIYRQLRGRGII